MRPRHLAVGGGGGGGGGSGRGISLDDPRRSHSWISVCYEKAYRTDLRTDPPIEMRGRI